MTEQHGEMCPNCVTPWKCNGPHVLRFVAGHEDGVREMTEPMTMTSAQWMDCLAHAWDLGHLSLCRRHGNHDFEACRNPYRVERAEK